MRTANFVCRSCRVEPLVVELVVSERGALAGSRVTEPLVRALDGAQSHERGCTQRVLRRRAGRSVATLGSSHVVDGERRAGSVDPPVASAAVKGAQPQRGRAATTRFLAQPAARIGLRTRGREGRPQSDDIPRCWPKPAVVFDPRNATSFGLLFSSALAPGTPSRSSAAPGRFPAATMRCC